MVDKILKDIRNKVSIHNSEVELFQQMSKSILKFNKGFFIDETHGKKANVEYASIRGVTEVCEISDLLILSKKKNKVRVTFWQAKKEKNPKWLNSNLRNTLNTGCFDFNCQFNQWELLNHRPLITGVANFKPPATLLESFESPSIGSYGVFYDYNGLLEINYSIAEFIASDTFPPINGKRTKAKPRMAINESLSKYYLFSDEKVVCRDSKSFILSLLRCEIGALINLNRKEHQWLVQYVYEMAIVHKKIDLFNNIFPDIPIEDNNSMYEESGGLSILVIDSSDDMTLYDN